MFSNNVTATGVLVALVVIAALGAGSAAATGGLFTAAAADTASPATTNDSATANETATFSITVVDSANGVDTETGTLTVGASAAPADFPGTAEQFTAIAGDDGEIGTFDLVGAIQGASDDSVHNGVEFTTFDFVDIIGWNSNR